VHPISVRPPDRPPDHLTPAEHAEWESTFYVLDAGVWGFLRAHLATLFVRPARYLRAVCTAFAFGRFHPVRTAYALFYFAEAIVAGNWLEQRKFEHYHSHYSSTIALFITAVFSIPVSMTIHGSDEFIDPEGFWLPQKIAISSFVCAISYYGQSQLMRVSPVSQWRKFEVVPLGIDMSAA
jgi:hypothetical protein